MAELNIHRVAKVEVIRKQKHNSKGRIFFVEEIQITDSDGVAIEISLFSDSKDNLKVIDNVIKWV